MQTRPLPGSDVALSVVGLGCWTLGGAFWGPDQDDARAERTVHAALDAGINWVDTAPLYGYGHADGIVARALAGRPEALVATKVGVRWDGEHAESDLRAEHVTRDCEASLRRLGRDRIDLLQVHWPCDRGTPLAETVGALRRLQERGLVRAIGLCNYAPDALAEARDLAPIATLQTPLSLLRREYEGPLQAEVCRRGGRAAAPVVGLAYEALCRGLLTGKHRSPPQFSEDDQRSWDPRFTGPRFAHARGLVDDLARVADKVDCSVPALCLGWTLTRSGVGAVVAGARTPAQIHDNAGAADLLGRKKLWSVVDRIAALHGGL